MNPVVRITTQMAPVVAGVGSAMAVVGGAVGEKASHSGSWRHLVLKHMAQYKYTTMQIARAADACRKHLSNEQQDMAETQGAPQQDLDCMERTWSARWGGLPHAARHSDPS